MPTSSHDPEFRSSTRKRWEAVLAVPAISPRALEDLRRPRRTFDSIGMGTPLESCEDPSYAVRSVPLDRLDPTILMEASPGATEVPSYLYCRSGGRGRNPGETFHASRFPSVVDVGGGTPAREQAGFAVVRGQKAISRERQVKIATWALLALGTALGVFVHPGFLSLAGFVGAALVSARIKDTCGVGLIMARMPWNRTGEIRP